MDKHFIGDADEVIRLLGALNERFDGQTIILTGAGGFLGTHFVHYFLRLNDTGRLRTPCRLIAMDNGIRGVPNWLKALGTRPDCRVEIADIVRQQTFPQSDFIIHAASIASPLFYRKFPIETMDANVIGLRNLLEHCGAHRPTSMLFFSTSEIYGDPDPKHIPTEETYRGNVSCTGPRACYDESKRFGETLCVNFAAERQVPVAIARPFNNYGPGLRLSDRRVLPDFFRDALAGSDIELLSDGQATRTFCYVSDAINGYLRILLLGKPGEPYNIGSDRPEVNMLELAALVIKTVGVQASVLFRKSDDKHYLTDNPQRRCPDLTKAREYLGYVPAMGLEEGLKRACAYYRDHLDE